MSANIVADLFALREYHSFKNTSTISLLISLRIYSLYEDSMGAKIVADLFALRD
ncbi:hypothetical protein [Brochothrix thermosphacta]|uniref:hypothetical protein n=1 Tax=Brochothrix thermosphacta TaxID=2756 RepID=UPI0039B01D87